MTQSPSTPYATRLTPAEATRTVLQSVATLPVVRLPLGDARGSVLAEDVRSPIDLPPWDNSAMDGFAVLRDDVLGKVPVELDVVDDIPAGGFPTRAIARGTCARIFTGAPIPQGADSVIRQEDTTALDGGRVRIDDARDAGRNIRPRGEDLQRDSVALTRGTELGPAHIGVLASIAQREVPVYRSPTVAYMASGDEIAELDEHEAILSGRKIASSNSYTMDGTIREAGGEPVNLGIARDDPEDLRRRIASAGDADLLVTSAGVSVGEHDYLRSVLEELGADIKFWRIRMRPGAPVGFGLLGTLPWVGLPGNPVSTMVTFELFVRPAIRKMRGHATLFRRAIPVIAAEPIALHAPLTHFLRAVVSENDGRMVARLTGPQGSGLLTSMVRANALLIVPEVRQKVEAGEALQAILLNEPVHLETANY